VESCRGQISLTSVHYTQCSPAAWRLTSVRRPQTNNLSAIAVPHLVNSVIGDDQGLRKNVFCDATIIFIVVIGYPDASAKFATQCAWPLSLLVTKLFAHLARSANLFQKSRNAVEQPEQSLHGVSVSV
jgi:hypothetical protein